MKIALFQPKFLTPRANSGSYLIVAQNQARSFARNGHDVLVLTESGGEHSSSIEPNLVIYPLTGLLTAISSRFSAANQRIPTYSTLFSPDILISAARMLKREQVDIIYSCGTSFMAFPTALLGSLAKIPTAHYVFQYAGPWKWWRAYLDTFQGYRVPFKYTLSEAIKNSLYHPLRFEFIHKWGLKHINQIIAGSHSVRESLTPYSLYPEDIPVIYPGVDTGHVIPAPELETPTITYMGHLWQGRGVLDLVKAFSIVAKANPHVQLKIAASNINELTQFYFEDLIGEYALENRITRCGIVNDPYSELIAPSTAMVFPYREKSSIKLLEAMAGSKPVVTTNVDWIPEVIQDDENGLLVNPGDISGLADRLLRILEYKELVIKLGQNAKRTVQEKFDSDRNAEKLAQILSDTIISTRKPDI